MAGAALAAVQTQQGILGGYATTALAAATAAMEALGSADYGYIIGSTVNKIGPFIQHPLTLPPAPIMPSIGEVPSIPGITLPVRPTKPDTVLPVAPTLTDMVIPGIPSVTTPTMDTVTKPALFSIGLSDLPKIDIKDFEIDPPEPIELEPPIWEFPVDKILISDDPMVKAMIDRLKNNIVNGGTGLSEAVEADIWNRDLERMEQQIEDSSDKLTSMWAKKGFSLPDGLLAHSLSELQKEYMNKRIDRSREISVKQAELEQSNLFKSMEIAVNLVFKLIDELNKHANLVFQTQEATAKFFNEYLRLRIEAHNSIIEVFKARVQMYELSVRANMAKVDIYKAQIEGETAKAGLNESQVKLYSAEIQAAVEKYKGVLEGNDLQVRIFTAQVQSVLAQSQVNESMIKAYAEQVRAVMVGTELYKAEVEGMTAELGVEKAKIDAATAAVMGWAKGADAKIAAYSASIEVFRAQGQTNVAVAEMANKAAQVILGGQIASAQVGASITEAVGRSMAASYQTRMEAAKGVASAASSLAAGAMAAVHAQASMSYQETQPLKEAS